MSMLVNPYLFGLPYTAPLDVLPAAAAGVSFRKLRSAYTGDCAILRRSSDNAEATFGFRSDGYIDTAAISAWASSSSVYVIGMLDQTGNNQTYNQGVTASKQPRLMNAGTFETLNGFAGALFIPGNQTWYGLGAGFAGNNYSAGTVIQSKSGLATGPYSIYSSSGDGVNYYLYGNGVANTALVLDKNNVNQLAVTGYNIVPGMTQLWMRAGNSSSTVQIGYNGIYVSNSITPTFFGNPAFQYGFFNYRTTNSYFDGLFFESIVYTSLISDADRDTLVANQRSYWGTP